MSDLQGGTIKERLARLETMMCNHLEHHKTITRLLLGITIASTSGMVLLVLPGFIKWLAGVV
jgi:hypothetical protein